MKYLPTILMLVAVIAFIVGTIYYFSCRFSMFFPALSKRTWIVTFSILTTIVLIGLMGFSTTANPIGKSVFMFSGIMSGIFIILLLSLAISDFLCLLFQLGRQPRCILSIGLTALLTIYSIWNAYTVKVKEITIPIVGLTHEIRALHLTDVHLGNFRGEKQIKKLTEQIRELAPDVIFNTGDMFDSKTHFANNHDILAALQTLHIPHYFVYGNHDEYVGVKTVIEQMKRAGANVLLNDTAYFDELQIIGLNNMLPDRNTFDPHAKPGSQTIEEVLNAMDIKTGMPTILLHHRPDGVEYMQEKGVDLLLAGHTHGGQIFPMTIIAQLMFGYNTGRYNYKDMAIYVSEGIGTIFTPLRLGTSSEMSVIRLTPLQSKH